MTEVAVAVVGELFGPYRLDARIGEGGMGEVFRAFDTVKERTVALKRLSAHRAGDPEFEARFRRESKIAAGLRSRHVIPIHDFGEIDGQLYLDMQLVDGVDLGALIAQQGRLAPDRAVRILAQLCRALDTAHRDGLVHRDVKPSNALVADAETGDDFVYLIDFGIARSTFGTRVTATGQALGTVSYMAPERVKGEGEDYRGDVYSLGCLLFETLTGAVPFTADDRLVQMYAHVHSMPPKPSDRVDVPPAIDDVVARAMAKDPDERYASAGELATAARAALVHRVTPSVPRIGPPPFRPPRPVSPPRRIENPPPPPSTAPPTRETPQPNVASPPDDVTPRPLPRTGDLPIRGGPVTESRPGRSPAPGTGDVDPEQSSGSRRGDVASVPTLGGELPAGHQVFTHEPATTRRAPPSGRPTRRQPDPLDRIVDGAGRGAARVAHGAGRGLSRTRGIGPAFRRDGLAVLCLVLAVVMAAGVWWGAGGPVIRGLSTALGAVFGLVDVVVPVLVLIIGLVLLTTEPHREGRPRIVVGLLLQFLSVCGLVHLAVGATEDPALWAQGGGAIGYVAAIPLATALTAWAAVPILLALFAFALLVLTGTPVREVPDLLRSMTGRGAEEEDEDDS